MKRAEPDTASTSHTQAGRDNRVGSQELRDAVAHQTVQNIRLQRRLNDLAAELDRERCLNKELTREIADKDALAEEKEYLAEKDRRHWEFIEEEREFLEDAKDARAEEMRLDLMDLEEEFRALRNLNSFGSTSSDGLGGVP
jgi:hypothetical protein